jgi:hypothetical protein
MFEVGIREAAWEALAILRYDTDEKMAHSLYRHFPSRVEEGAKAMVLPAGDHDRMGCFTDQVKLTPALVWDLDEAIKEVKLLGDHEEESTHKITELEALCNKLWEDTQRLEEEKATLEGMVESHDELLMKIFRETRLDHTEEDDEDEEDADDGGDATAPLAAAPPPPVPLVVAPEEIDDESPVEMIPEQEAQCCMKSSWQMLILRCHSSISIMHS